MTPSCLERAAGAGGQRDGDLCHVAAVAVRVGLRPRRTHREQHVRPGVGICHREYVEPIDLVGVGNEVADGGVCPVPQGGGIEPPSRHRTSSHCGARATPSLVSPSAPA